jgi:hypothetical protein
MMMFRITPSTTSSFGVAAQTGSPQKSWRSVAWRLRYCRAALQIAPIR